jgi:hypothetical protein
VLKEVIGLWTGEGLPGFVMDDAGKWLDDILEVMETLRVFNVVAKIVAEFPELPKEVDAMLYDLEKIVRIVDGKK